VRYCLDEYGSDVTTLLGPAVVLVATIATLWIALGQLDQTATTPPPSRRAPDPDIGPAPTPRPEAHERPVARRSGERRRSPAPVMMTPAMPAMPGGFDWTDAKPVPRIRSGLALIVILAVIGALLAMAVAGLIVGATLVFKGI
jgi:hypothetical protein